MRQLPHAPWYNTALRSSAELAAAFEQTRALGLDPHPDYAKNWDHLAALDFILSHTGLDACILDAGADRASRMLPWLEIYGYKRLFGINPVFGSPFVRGNIQYLPGSIESTAFDGSEFDVVTCMSVLEHGVSEGLYFRETSRILKPGGYLITSTDYYPQPVDTHGKVAFGVPIKIFSEADIARLLTLASRCGLAPERNIQFECAEKPIAWKGLRYSFIIFILRKL